MYAACAKVQDFANKCLSLFLSLAGKGEARRQLDLCIWWSALGVHWCLASSAAVKRPVRAVRAEGSCSSSLLALISGNAEKSPF